LAQHGDGIADLEVRRASLEDSYVTLVQQFESGSAPEALKQFEEARR
jgi:ABC-2 type transport system ATP-binding protein